MKHQWVAALLHVVLVVVVYVLYLHYPPYQVPLPYFETLTYAAGAAYGVAGVLQLRAYLRDLQQAQFNMAVLLVVIGGLLFMAEGIGNAH